MNNKSDPFTDEEIKKMKKYYEEKREYYREHPEEAEKAYIERMESDNKSLIESWKKMKECKDDKFQERTRKRIKEILKDPKRY